MSDNFNETHELDVYLEPMVEVSGGSAAEAAEPVIICVSGCAAKPR